MNFNFNENEFRRRFGLSYRPKKKKNGNFPEKLLLNWIVEMILALDYIHEKKILHRDIKCSNVFLTSNNTVKLGDFGISKILENSNEIAMTFVGTPYFMRCSLIIKKFSLL